MAKGRKQEPVLRSAKEAEVFSVSKHRREMANVYQQVRTQGLDLERGKQALAAAAEAADWLIKTRFACKEPTPAADR